MSLLICTPCYGGQVTEPYFASCIRLKEALIWAGLEHDWLTLSNESLVQRARNTCVSRFLGTEYQKLLFIDADISFEPDHVAELWNMDENVAVGVYAMKKPGAHYAAWVDGALVSDLDQYKEPVKVDYAGTGFMMIDRQVFEAMRKAWPGKEHEDGVGTSFAWFDPRVEDEIYLSEDYAFCLDARSLGYDIVMNTSIRLKHHGTYAFG